MQCANAAATPIVASGRPERRTQDHHIHYFDHAVYYRFLRRELGYQPMHAELVTRLQATGLYQHVEMTPGKVLGATMPGLSQSLIGRFIRHRVREGSRPGKAETRD
jgi:hypothetical protein